MRAAPVTAKTIITTVARNCQVRCLGKVRIPFSAPIPVELKSDLLIRLGCHEGGLPGMCLAMRNGKVLA